MRATSRGILIVVGLLPVWLVAGQYAKADDAPKQKTANIAHIALNKEIPEKPQPTGFLGEQEDNLQAVLNRIEKAGKDPDIKALYLQVSGEGYGWGKIHEIRVALDEFKKSGKPSFAVIDDGSTASYVLAAGTDEVIVPPAGWLLLTGLRMEVTYMKDLLDKLGLKADIMQVGDFKGAGEPLTRSTMSEAFREQLTSVLDSYYSQLVDQIAKSRKLDPAKVRELVDNGPYTPEEAQKYGLIDHAEYVSDMRDRLKKEWGVDKVVMKMNYGRRNIDQEFEGFAGLMKLFTLMSTPPKKANPPFSLHPAIALIYATGTIESGEGENGMGDGSVGSSSMVRAIRSAAANGKVRAIVVRIDSPGGSALASDLIWHELKKTGKPVVASMGNTAASGGYYIAMAGNKIFAEPGTLTGSIGVVGGKVALGGLMDKVGVNSVVLSRGKNANIMSAISPFNESERKAFDRLLKDTYARFTSKVAESRHMSMEKLETLAGGRVWTGLQAKENGLVDEIGTLEDAIKSARELAGIGPDDKIEMITLPETPSILEAIFGSPESGAPRDAKIVLMAKLFPELAPVLETTHWLSTQLKSDRALLVSPMLIRVR